MHALRPSSGPGAAAASRGTISAPGLKIWAGSQHNHWQTLLTVSWQLSGSPAAFAPSLTHSNSVTLCTKLLKGQYDWVCTGCAVQLPEAACQETQQRASRTLCCQTPPAFRAEALSQRGLALWKRPAQWLSLNAVPWLVMDAAGSCQWELSHSVSLCGVLGPTRNKLSWRKS